MSTHILGSEESRLHGGEIGFLYFTFTGRRKQELRKIRFNPDAVYFKPGSSHTFLTIGDDNHEDLNELKVEYRFKQTFNPLTWRIFTPRIYVESITIESMERGSIVKVCPVHQMSVAENEAVMFKESSCLHRQ
jgi:hypothetical protein